MRIVKHGLIFSGMDRPELSSCCFPALCQIRNGTIFASFRGAAQKGPFNIGECAVTCISEDNGNTWSDPLQLFEAPLINGKPTTIRTLYFADIAEGNLLAVMNAIDASMEDLPFYNEATEGLKETYILFSHSADNGRTWSPPERLQVSSFYDLPLPLTGAPFVTKDGRIGIQFEVNKHYHDETPWIHHSCAVYSEDGGYTWGNEVIITDSPTVYYWDQRIDTLADGRVVDIFWTFDREVGDYVNIHFCQSENGGRTFGPLIDTGLAGQPGNVIDGKDGTMLAIYINRDAAPVIRLAESADGTSWTDVLTVFDFGSNTKGKRNAGMNDVWAEMGAFSVGHPFLKRMQDGTIWAYYYSGPSTHRTDFHFAKIVL